jgi:hypothetical protein
MSRRDEREAHRIKGGEWKPGVTQMPRLETRSAPETHVTRVPPQELAARSPRSPVFAPAPGALQETLDALSAHIAVLDENGAIIMTNRAWASSAWPMEGLPAKPPAPTT